MKWGNKGGLRGAVFETVVKHLAISSGYRLVPPNAQDLQLYHLNLLPMVHGLGEGHNADVLLDYPFHLAMTPKMRLLIECKGYQRQVGLDVIREAVGLRLDLNSFRQLTDDELRLRSNLRRPSRTPLSFPHYNVAVASLHGFSAHAQAFAATHHIELLDYGGLPMLAEIPDLISSLDINDFRPALLQSGSVDDSDDDVDGSLPEHVRRALDIGIEQGSFDAFEAELRRRGLAVTVDAKARMRGICEATTGVRYSYMATLSGGLHVHMLSRAPLRIDRHVPGFDLEFTVHYVREDRGRWVLRPTGDENDTELDFALPAVLLARWEQSDFERDVARAIKNQHFEAIELVGPVMVDGNQVVVRHLVCALENSSRKEAQRAALPDARKSGMTFDYEKR